MSVQIAQNLSLPSGSDEEGIVRHPTIEPRRSFLAGIVIIAVGFPLSSSGVESMTKSKSTE